MANIGGLETSVDNDVDVGVESDEFDVVNSGTETIRMSSSFKLKLVLSSLDHHFNLVGVDSIIRGDNGGDDDIVPDDQKLARQERYVISASILELKDEFVGECVRGVSWGRWGANFRGFRKVWFLNAGRKLRWRRRCGNTELWLRNFDTWGLDCRRVNDCGYVN